MMGYKITSVEGNKAYIKHDLRDELGGFITLLKSIEGELGGRIIQLDGDDIRYRIQTDPFDLVYQWDTELGLTVIAPEGTDMDKVVDMLNGHIDKLNN